ncbi:FtsB family cell division protein [Paenibacillus sp. 481]|uniref:FtsB family cell division protein n=1 Tax=Paenibacillus sp. 481 TaxID=2835869 RepID=UPI001E40D6DB|nr:septum formation initiator family protein [Paenibacillus sp. 481]
MAVSRHSSKRSANDNTQMNVTKRRLRIWLMFMTLFLCWGVYTFFSQMFQMQDLEKESADRQAIKTQAEKARNELKQEVDRLNTTEYILQLARSRGWVLPNEVIIRKQDE